jgi:hypothetical protein
VHPQRADFLPHALFGRLQGQETPKLPVKCGGKYTSAAEVKGEPTSAGADVNERGDGKGQTRGL